MIKNIYKTIIRILITINNDDGTVMICHPPFTIVKEAIYFRNICVKMIP